MYPTINSYNMTGVETVFVYLNDISGGLFIAFLLFSIFMVFTFGPYFAQKKLTGNGDFIACFAVGSWTVLIVAILLRLIPGLVNSLALGVCIALVVVAMMALFFDKSQEANV